MLYDDDAAVNMEDDDHDSADMYHGNEPQHKTDSASNHRFLALKNEDDDEDGKSYIIKIKRISKTWVYYPRRKHSSQ